jgi:hypothetical protein
MYQDFGINLVADIVDYYCSRNHLHYHLQLHYYVGIYHIVVLNIFETILHYLQI